MGNIVELSRIVCWKSKYRKSTSRWLPAGLNSLKIDFFPSSLVVIVIAIVCRFRKEISHKNSPQSSFGYSTYIFYICATFFLPIFLFSSPPPSPPPSYTISLSSLALCVSVWCWCVPISHETRRRVVDVTKCIASYYFTFLINDKRRMAGAAVERKSWKRNSTQREKFAFLWRLEIEYRLNVRNFEHSDTCTRCECHGLELPADDRRTSTGRRELTANRTRKRLFSKRKSLQGFHCVKFYCSKCDEPSWSEGKRRAKAKRRRKDDEGKKWKNRWQSSKILFLGNFDDIIVSRFVCSVTTSWLYKYCIWIKVHAIYTSELCQLCCKYLSTRNLQFGKSPPRDPRFSKFAYKCLIQFFFSFHVILIVADAIDFIVATNWRLQQLKEERKVKQPKKKVYKKVRKRRQAKKTTTIFLLLLCVEFGWNVVLPKGKKKLKKHNKVS